MTDVNETWHSLLEITSDSKISRVVVSDDEVMRVNADSAWEIRKIYTDYARPGCHKDLIVVFGRKEERNELEGRSKSGAESIPQGEEETERE